MVFRWFSRKFDRFVYVCESLDMDLLETTVLHFDKSKSFGLHYNCFNLFSTASPSKYIIDNIVIFRRIFFNKFIVKFLRKSLALRVCLNKFNIFAFFPSVLRAVRILGWGPLSGGGVRIL